MGDAAMYLIEELVPHTGPMCLLDRVIDAGDEHLVAEVTIRADDLFADGGAVGAWVGIEYMAQAVAAWAGWRARVQGGAPKIGLLLGTRDYRSLPHRPMPDHIDPARVSRRQWHGPVPLQHPRPRCGTGQRCLERI